MTESGQKVEQQTEKGLEWFLGNVKDCTEFLVVCWAFLMLTVFPVYVIDHYQDIGAYKFAFFSGVSTLFLVPGAVLGLVYAVLKPFGGKREKVRAEGDGFPGWISACSPIFFSIFFPFSEAGLRRMPGRAWADGI